MSGGRGRVDRRVKQLSRRQLAATLLGPCGRGKPQPASRYNLIAFIAKTSPSAGGSITSNGCHTAYIFYKIAA